MFTLPFFYDMTVGMYNTRSLDGFTYISTKEKATYAKKQVTAKQLLVYWRGTKDKIIHGLEVYIAL